MTARLFCARILIAAAGAAIGCGSNGDYIGGSKIPRTSENEGIIKRLEEYRLAVEQRDAGKLLAMASKEYFEDSGTPTGADDYGYDRLREVLTGRFQEARSIRAQGAKQAQIIQAEADAEAARTYAASFGKDPQFYDFYRAMQSYRTTFLGEGGKAPAPTTIVLSPQNDYLKEFSGRSR